MNRMTVKRDDGRWAIANNDGSTINQQFEKFPVAVAKLAAYEDTGLEPEEIDELLHKSYGPMHKKLGEWISAEKNGRLMIQPQNAPLNLEELRKMDGEPVWVQIIGYIGYYALIEGADGENIYMQSIDDQQDYGRIELYGETWIAYRHKPDDGTL